MKTLIEAAAALAAGHTTAAALTDEALARIAAPAGEGARAFITVHADTARASAAAMDALRTAGRAPSAYAGIPISIKDLYDESRRDHARWLRGAEGRAAGEGDAPPRCSAWCAPASSSSAAPTWWNSPSPALA